MILKMVSKIIPAIIALIAPLCHSKTYNFETEGGIPNDSDCDIYTNLNATCNHNTNVFNTIILNLQSNDVFYLPNKTFWFNGGIGNAYVPERRYTGLQDITFLIDGTFSLQDNRDWYTPEPDRDHVANFFGFWNLDNVTFTSNGKGTIQGNGAKWWGYIRYLINEGDRPKLLDIGDSKNLLVEHIVFLDPPEWTTWFNGVENLEIRYSAIDVRRNDRDEHGLWNLGSLNTDGFDVKGKNIYIHDVDIWNDDDCICVKDSHGADKIPCSQDMVFENIRASGLGLALGSIRAREDHTCIRNITFRNAYMHNTVKGIYLKTRSGYDGPGDYASGIVEDVLFENVTMFEPKQWPIWIGPNQAAYADACALEWPYCPVGVLCRCPVPAEISVKNITLKDIKIIRPDGSPGLVMANSTNPFERITFDNVIVEEPGLEPWGEDFYKCENTEGYVRRGTWPVPKCFVNALDCGGGEFCAYGDKCVRNSDGNGLCEICGEGSYCGDGDTETACPDGYTSGEGAKTVDECFEVEVTSQEITTDKVSTVESSTAEDTTSEILTTSASLKNLPVFILFYVRFLLI